MIIYFFSGIEVAFFLGAAIIIAVVTGYSVGEVFLWISEHSIYFCLASVILTLIVAIIYYHMEKDPCMAWSMFANAPLIPVIVILGISKIVEMFKEDIGIGIIGFLPTVLLAMVLLAVFLLLMVFGMYGLSGFREYDDDKSSDTWRFFRALIVCIIQNIILLNF